ncbi:MAG TPA: ribonuclease HII [Magnetospirillaceae bacterium]|nr:ribonuclease HII [Magnetospirillaceae bacterium]
MLEQTWEDLERISNRVCGIDEAGRGPLAGPVCAAAVILPPDFPTGILADSKALTADRRRRAAELILERAWAWGLGWASPAEIDRADILTTTLKAMARAYAALGMEADLVLVDGNRVPRLGAPCRAVIGGDRRIPAVMAASILAKTARDRIMERYDWLYPGYGYADHKGYPTLSHRAACLRLGPSPIQRTTFRVKS